VDRPPLSPTDFASAVTAITSAFGDPTRREIYLYVHASDGGATAGDVAETFDLHPNVARHHLDKLVAGAYVEVTVARPAGGGAGRPSKR
jgi:predicted ArsR family transcriptional regulator